MAAPVLLLFVVQLIVVCLLCVLHCGRCCSKISCMLSTLSSGESLLLMGPGLSLAHTRD